MTYVFRLYISEGSLGSLAASANLEKLCHALGEDRCRVEVIDIRKDPKRANADRVFAIPTLVKAAPPPFIRFVGDLSNAERLWQALETWTDERPK